MNNPSTTALHITPKRIMQTGMGFWASRTLLTAVKIGVFTVLGCNRKFLRQLNL